MNVAATQTEDQFAGWKKLLAGEQTAIHPDTPLSGYYRARMQKDGAWLPIAIWRDSDGKLWISAAGQDAIVADRVWPYCAKNPISYELFIAVSENGAPWPEELPADATPGHNEPPADNSFEWLRDQIKMRADQALALIKKGPATTQDEANKAADLTETLSKLLKSAEGKFEEEKRPFEEPLNAVKVKWRAVLDMADIYKRIKGAVINPFLVAERDRIKAKERADEDARQKLIDDRRKQIEDAFAAAMEDAKSGINEADDKYRMRILLRATPLVTPIDPALAAQIAAATGKDLDGIGEAHRVARVPGAKAPEPGKEAAPPVQAPPPPPSAPAPRTAPLPQSRGGTGKALGLTMLHRAKIVDVQLVLAHFSGHPDIITVLQKLANASVKMKIIPPGCEDEEYPAGGNG